MSITGWKNLLKLGGCVESLLLEPFILQGSVTQQPNLASSDDQMTCDLTQLLLFLY